MNTCQMEFPAQVNSLVMITLLLATIIISRSTDTDEDVRIANERNLFAGLLFAVRDISIPRIQGGSWLCTITRQFGNKGKCTPGNC